MFARRVYYDAVFQEDQPLEQQPIYNCLLYDYGTDPSQANGAPHPNQGFLVPSPDMSYGYAGETGHFARWRNPEVLPTIVEARSISVEEYDQMCTCVRNRPVCDVNQGAVVQGEFAFIANGARNWGYGDAYGRHSSHYINRGTAKGLIPELLIRPPQVLPYQGRSNQFAAVEAGPPTVHARSHDELACQSFKSHLPSDTHHGFRHTGPGSVIEHGDSIQTRDKGASSRNLHSAVKVSYMSKRGTYNGFPHTGPRNNVGSAIEHGESIETRDKEASSRNLHSAVKMSHMSKRDNHNGFRHTDSRTNVGSVIQHGDSVATKLKEASGRNLYSAVKASHASTRETHNNFRHTGPRNNAGSVIEHGESIETKNKDASGRNVKSAVKASHMTTKRVNSEGHRLTCSDKYSGNRKRKVLEFWESAEKEVREKIEHMCSSPVPQNGEQSVQQPQAAAQNVRKQKVLEFWESTEKEVREKIEKICSSPVPQKGEHGFRASEESPPCSKSVQQSQATAQDRQDYVTRDFRQDGDARRDVRQDGDARRDVRQDGDVVYVKQVPKKRRKLHDIVMRLKGSSS